MSRTRFVVTSADYLHASEYLTNQLRLRKLELLESYSWVDAERAFMSVVGGGHKATVRVALLQEWCESHLSARDWNKLQTNVRKRRQRWKTSEATKSITVSAEVHTLLTRLANRDNVTFDDVLHFALTHTLRSGRTIKPKDSSRSRGVRRSRSR
ncbi:hypothetical protein SH449x_000190 [Pirellulaceae bacterium SH449]